MRFRILSSKEIGGARARADLRTQTIELSTVLFREWKRKPVRGWVYLKRTILHELAHLQTNSGHTKAWRERTIAMGGSFRGNAKARNRRVRWVVRDDNYPFNIIRCGCKDRVRGNDKHSPDWSCGRRTTHYARYGR